MVDQLPIEQLRRTIDPDSLGITGTADIQPREGIVGQDRALHALRFGLGIREPGFNIYVSGMPGTGRTAAVKAYLEEIAKGGEAPPDWCYVNNFKDQYRPRAIKLPPGKGKVFQSDVKRLIETIRREVPRVFDSEPYATQREQLGTELNRQREAIVNATNTRAQQQGFAIQATPVGLALVPLKNGRPYTDEEMAALSPRDREALSRKQQALEEEIHTSMRQLRAIEKTAMERLENFDREVALASVGALVTDLAEDYQDNPAILEYFQDLQNDIVENIGQFRAEGTPTPEGPFQAQVPWLRELAFRKYEVNVIVDNTGRTGAPVVMEFNPAYTYLFGRIEREAQFGALVTDLTLIRPGSLHQANGGYLVCDIEDVLRNPFSWDGLKRALRDGNITIEEPGEKLGFVVTKSLMPEPIPLSAKVLVIGNPMLYQMLFGMDEEFKHLFKVKADFDTQMDLTPENARAYVASLCAVCHKEHLPNFDIGAVVKLLEQSSRLAEDQKKLSTRFSEITDIMREASYWAGQDNKSVVEAPHVQRAIEERLYRSNLIEERIREMMARDIIKIDTAGSVVGQVNGLAVVGMGDFAFGRPSRITAALGVGREGVVDIEREVKMGGPIHTKGVLILGGFLTNRFAQDKPLTVNARLVFEQSYEGIEGDSASSTELYALLSRLSGVPIKQSFAVTGSVNQWGEVQAIGGVNEKIEGYFSVCKVKGLTGDQGVVVPASNAEHLMLKEEVLEAASKGLFHIYAVKTIDEGIEVLTGVPAGERGADGKYPVGTINYLVDQKLRSLGQSLREFVRETSEEPFVLTRKREEEDEAAQSAGE
ncbi:MAG: AAA family ATPase [Bacteroidetes bacterium]|nr:AAA family ATPase [Bacteroidota bacterium]MCL5026323.1 AAA family ATPase [Chloroflexota bacterium]